MGSTDESAQLLSWLQQHGVSSTKARLFCSQTGCQSVPSLALYLRFQLSFPFSNEDMLNTDMAGLFGIGPSQGKRLIQDLDLTQAISLDTAEEATKLLEATGQLPANSNLREHLDAATGSILWGTPGPLFNPSTSNRMNWTSGRHSLRRIDEGRKDETPPVADALDGKSTVPTGTVRKYASGKLSHSGKLSRLPTANSLPMYEKNLGTSGGLSMSFGRQQSTLCQTRKVGYPTTSHALDPGPYHKANAQLRRMLPHYSVKVAVRTAWHRILQWLLAFSTLIVYLTVRVIYLVTGKTSTLLNSPLPNIIYSVIILSTECVLGIVNLAGNLRFRKQEVRFSTSEDPSTQTDDNGDDQEAKLTVHVLITTYTESVETVRESMIRCLVAPEPSYMEKNIFLCDDGHAKTDGPRKRAMVEELRILGHTNVFYVGDRIKQPGQLNGKSANLNHAILRKVFPSARKPEDIPFKDVLMVMDVDHMVKPEIFNRMGPCMMNEEIAVTLVPQRFHNVLLPDAFDFANAHFMFSILPFDFGAGACIITGTNVMIRARCAYEVCKGSAQALHKAVLEDGEDLRRIYAEDQVSEDVELGSRMHAAGFKSVFLTEGNLATGEVPLDPRSFWRQRLRWAKGGHLYVLDPAAVIWAKSPHMSLYHKFLYCFPLISHFIAVWADPILFTLPFVCLIMDVCPYGMDKLLFWTQIGSLVGQTLLQVQPNVEQTITSFRAMAGNRLMYFTYVKAVVNTLMVAAGYKNPGHFKFTPKAGNKSEGSGASGIIGNSSPLAPSSRGGKDSQSFKREEEEEEAAMPSSQCSGKRHSRFNFTSVHRQLSKVTELRRHCMPLDGTLDIWVLTILMGLSLLAAATGLFVLMDNNALLKWDGGRESLRWIAVVWAVSDCIPALQFLGYLICYVNGPKILKVWLPAASISTRTVVFLIYVRLIVGFVFNT